MTKINFIILLLLISFFGNAQISDSDDFRNYPVVITLQFQSFAMPFQNIKGHFRNIGIGIGTEVSHNGNHDWVQHIDFIWYKNKTMGNGLVISTQSGWRPYINNPLYTEVKLGLAYFHLFRPEDSYKQINNNWKNVGKKGKGMLAIPAGLTVGLHNYQEGSYTAPFLAYQFMLATNYSESLSITPWSFIQIGSSTHIK